MISSQPTSSPSSARLTPPAERFCQVRGCAHGGPISVGLFFTKDGLCSFHYSIWLESKNAAECVRQRDLFLKEMAGEDLPF